MTEAPADEPGSPVVAACAEQREQAPAPYTVADAVHDARYMRRVQECIVSDRQAKRVTDTLLAALESSPCFLNAVMRGQRVFCLVEQDRAAPIAIRRWVEIAAAHGCGMEKVRGAYAISHDWETSAVEKKWPD